MKLYRLLPVPVYAFAYRRFQRVLHRMHLHHMPSHVMEDGATMRWCHWCGIRHVEPLRQRPVWARTPGGWD